MWLGLVISLPMLVCLFWTVYFLVTVFQWEKESRPVVELILFYAAATVLYSDHWLYFSGIVSLWGEWSYGVMNLCVYPLYYAYLCSLTRTPRFKELSVLLLPAVAAVFLFPIGRFGGYAGDAEMFHFLHICFAVQVIWVLVRGGHLLMLTIRQLDDTYSDDRSRLLRPTYILLLLFGITAVVSMVLNFLGRDYFAQDAPISLPAVVMTVLLYGLGYVAAHTVIPKESVTDDTHPHNENTEILQHEKDDVSVQLQTRIENALAEQKMYCNPDLTIVDLAAAVNSNRTYVSAVINKAYGVNFNTFVNQYRVECAKQILSSPEFVSDKEAIQDAIVRSGFANEQTFYRIFKQQTSTTPLAWRKQNISH